MKSQYIGTICLPVQDFERAKAFYTQVMGFTVKRDVRGGPSYDRWIELSPEGGQTTIALIDKMLSASGPIKNIVLKVTDMVECRAHLRHHGLRPDEIKEETWGSHLSVEDPEGNKWILVDYSVDG